LQVAFPNEVREGAIRYPLKEKLLHLNVLVVGEYRAEVLNGHIAKGIVIFQMIEVFRDWLGQNDLFAEWCSVKDEFDPVLM